MTSIVENNLQDTFLPPTMECEHVFRFVPCIGSYCKNCDIPYGVECLHPSCKIHHCEKHSLSYDSVNNAKTFADVVKDMTDDIYVLHLAHDGVISGTDDDVRKVLSFKGLKIVEYCYYYTELNVLSMFEDKKFSHIKFVPIE